MNERMVPGSGERIWITPQSFDPDQRREAVEYATPKNAGVRMEVHSSHTEYYVDPWVEVGKVEVWAANTYKGMLERTGETITADEAWVPESWRKVSEARKEAENG